MFVIFFISKVLCQDPVTAAATVEKRRMKRIKNAHWRRNVLLRKCIAAGKSGSVPQEITIPDPAVLAEKRRKKRARTARWRKRARLQKHIAASNWRLQSSSESKRGSVSQPSTVQVSFLNIKNIICRRRRRNGNGRNRRGRIIGRRHRAAIYGRHTPKVQPGPSPVPEEGPIVHPRRHNCRRHHPHEHAIPRKASKIANIIPGLVAGKEPRNWQLENAKRRAKKHV